MICKKLAESDRLLHVKNLSYRLQQQTILHDLNFVIPQSKLSVLIGPNGAGKSTLLRILSGYLTAEQGQCEFHQKPIQHYSATELAHQRAVMRQHSQLNFPFSVEDVIRMGGYHRRKQEIEQWLETVITITDCQSLRQKAYRQLSGGEQQRTQLARALLQLWSADMQGKLLFLDEPTSAFDLYHQQHCLRLMKQLCDEKGLTVFCILHDLNLASLYGDHILLLAEKQIQAQGSPYAVLTETQIQRWYKAEIKTLPHYATQTPQFQFCY
ncbi:heme ABC transporter ATP-binding protein [Glaesserella sp.]|uniref:heme ABC transporter ATP-binding protein n=1 Tax=Glaesserella sp. TaxID=2094731 RepID=UPI00359F60F6